MRLKPSLVVIGRGNLLLLGGNADDVPEYRSSWADGPPGIQ